MKKVCFVASEILTSGNNSIADLLISTPEVSETSSCEAEKDIYENITGEGDEPLSEKDPRERK